MTPMKVLTFLALITVTILFVASIFTPKPEPKQERLPKVIIVTAPSSHR